MINRVLVACLAFLAVSVHAQVSFTSTQFDVTAIALSDGAPGFETMASPPDPVSASAASFATNVATAGAIAGSGLLSTSADVSSVNGDVTSAVATSHFLGSFLGGPGIIFGIDFVPTDFASGSGGGGSTLFVTLKNGATTLFNDFLTGSRLFSYSTALGSIGTLELTLTSEANAGFLSATSGGFSSSGLVNLTTPPVPEPETYLLLVSGLLATSLWVRRRKAQGSPQDIATV